jgi:hypothetical protein
MMVREQACGPIDWQCPKCNAGGIITGWQDSLSNLSELRDASQSPFFEVVLREEQYDVLKRVVAMDLEWDDVISGATATDDGIILKAEGPTMRAFSDYLSRKLGEVKSDHRRDLRQVLDGIQMVLGRSCPQ